MNEAVAATMLDLRQRALSGVGPLPDDHPGVVRPRVGVLLINLGTPSGTDYLSMRRYLNEFLSDSRVIELPRWIWLPLLRLVILSKRPQRSGEAYAAIWNEEKDESPLRTFTRSQAQKLQARLGAEGIGVEWGMRYGEPSIADSLERLDAQGCKRIVMMALYPQYSASTMATAYDKAFDKLKAMRWQPAIRTMPPYHDDAGYVRLLARSIERHLAGIEHRPDKVIMSFHGLPKDYLLRGDPYHCHCQKTARLVQEELGWDDDRLMVCFQSRFGKAEWLRPYLDQTLEALPSAGVRHVAVVSPGFSVDCVETLEEINMQGRESFLEAGGKSFTYIPCLNDEDAHIDLIEELARREMQGWL